MALSYAHSAVQWLAADAVNTTYTVADPGFTIKFIKVEWCGLQSATDAASETVNQCRGIGFATGTANRRCVGSFSQDTAATSNCGTVAANDCVAITTDGAGVIDGKLDLSAFGAGLTFIVDDTAPQNITVFVKMWGGTDNTVAVVGDFAEPAAAGNQDYTATGFVASATDQCVMFAGVQSVAAIGTAEADASGLYAGWAAGTASADNNVIVGNADDGSPAMDTDGYCHTGECIALCAKAGAAVADARGVVTQWGTDNFRVNWIEVSGGARKSIYLAIKGGSWKSGSLLIDCSTLGNTATLSGLSFTPIGAEVMWTRNTQQAADVFVANDIMGFGCFSSTTSRRALATRDEDATASSACEIDLVLEYDEALVHPTSAGGTGTQVDINAMNSDGWQLIVDAVSGGFANTWLTYLTFGDAPVSTSLRRLMLAGVGN